MLMMIRLIFTRIVGGGGCANRKIPSIDGILISLLHCKKYFFDFKLFFIAGGFCLKNAKCQFKGSLEDG